MLKADFTAPDFKTLTRQGFVADMHFHTSYSHDCATPVKDIIRQARKLGIWVAITDHNRIGGVLEARRFKDAPIIPGIEICSREGKEVIAYFSDDKELKAFYDKRIKPYLKDKNALRSSRTPIPMADLLDFLSREQCVVHLPHPFGPQPRRSYGFFMRKQRAHLLPLVDSVEVFNSQMTRRSNLSALGWAVQLGKGAAGGSDGHRLRSLGRAVTVTNASSVAEHLDRIRKGDVRVYGAELRPHERAWVYASTTVKVKLQNGVKDGIRKGISFPGRASKRILDELRIKRMD